MTNFKFIYHKNFDAHFNMACEEYLLKQTDGYYIRLYLNEPSVIIGSNQNTLLEVNLKECEKLGVKVVRRLSGGGAVYHDLSNINYSIIAPYNAQEDGYRTFCAPVIEYLNSIGVKAEFSGRNDITVDGKKISGNAQVIYKDRILHHGTLLFDTNLSALEKVLIQNEIKVKAKGVKSIRARVTNIKEHTSISSNEFFYGLKNTLKQDFETYELTENDVALINELSAKKYSTYEWNVGASLKGNNRVDIRCSFGTLTLAFDLEKGLIQNAEIYGDFFGGDGILDFAKNLNGKRFMREDLLLAFDGVENLIKGANKEEIVNELL
ncbi:MAG: lipoate--protein ligase [Clostridia bacterium]|nr:lipoate--protein ligase [Clostridia bacterium]